MEVLIFYTVAYVLSIVLGFGSLCVVNKFSVENTPMKVLFIGTVIIETTQGKAAITVFCVIMENF